MANLCCEFLDKLLPTWPTQILARHIALLHGTFKKRIAPHDDPEARAFLKVIKHIASRLKAQEMRYSTRSRTWWSASHACTNQPATNHASEYGLAREALCSCRYMGKLRPRSGSETQMNALTSLLNGRNSCAVDTLPQYTPCITGMVLTGSEGNALSEDSPAPTALVEHKSLDPGVNVCSVLRPGGEDILHSNTSLASLGGIPRCDIAIRKRDWLLLTFLNAGNGRVWRNHFGSCFGIARKLERVKNIKYTIYAGITLWSTGGSDSQIRQPSKKVSSP
ncbi:hypothetical protein HPB51_028511 [Rhipicephalus microplus]|uniref:Uncharacterized protein n=1 Tax=Rhipicephalus microplus TaxID=6941 RepID=A0A9J6CXB8_RHIMP|nr:hypothetical protein HPB51_028511 [Rhipicephalus microplus]